ncbi:MAG: hypothetical protein HZA14_09735 [Nitrospirae bacterium]|nr:hypothetical protein [Nitrospirota bacterium]
MSFKNSIRRQLIVSLVLLAIIPLFLLGAVLSWQSFVTQQRQIMDLQREASKRVLDKILSVIREQEIVLSAALKINYNIMEMAPDRGRLISS